MARTRTTYTAEFKLRAVKMVTDQKLSVAEVARRLDVGENLLRQWKKTYLAQGDAAFPGHGNLPPAEDELRRLRAEVARLKAERDLLKKAAAYFASPPTLRSSSSPRTPTSGRSGGCVRPWRCRPAGTTPGPGEPTARPSSGGRNWSGRSRTSTPRSRAGTGARG